MGGWENKKKPSTPTHSQKYKANYTAWATLLAANISVLGKGHMPLSLQCRVSTRPLGRNEYALCGVLSCILLWGGRVGAENFWHCYTRYLNNKAVAAVPEKQRLASHQTVGPLLAEHSKPSNLHSDTRTSVASTHVTATATTSRPTPSQTFREWATLQNDAFSKRMPLYAAGPQISCNSRNMRSCDLH